MRETMMSERGRGWSVAVPSGAGWMLLVTVAGIAAGWGILTFPPIKVVAVGLGVLCILLAAWKIDAALYLVGVFMVLLQEGETTPGTLFALLERLNRPNIPSLLEVLFAVLAAAFAVRCFIMQDTRYTLYGMRVPLAIFFTILFFALANGIMDGTDHTIRKEDFKRFIFPIIFFVCAVNILDTRKKIVRLLWAMFWVMLAKTVAADLYYLKGMGFPYGDSFVVFMESGDQTLVVTTIVVAISLLAEREKGWKEWLVTGLAEREKGWKEWLVTGLALAPAFFALIFSYRRNALWGTLFSLGLLIFLSRRDKKFRLLKILAGAAVCAGCLMVFLPVTGERSTGRFITERLLSVTDRDNSSNKAHLNEWEITAEDIRKRPLAGLGLGSTHGVIPEFEGINVHSVHNAFLMLWMKMGLPALLLFLWCLYRYCRQGIREAVRRSDPMLTGLFATCALWFVAMNVGPSWFYYRESCLMALVMAMVVRLSRFSGAASADAVR